MPRFSLVVPAYGNAQYLPGCLDSVMRQDFADWEAIVVNDASPDDTSSIARGYAERDPRFRVVDKACNGGLHLARRTGVEAAEGDYVLFLDADDELCPGALSLLADDLPEGRTILHFGSECIPTDGMDEKTARSFEEWVNAAYPPLGRDDLLAAIYSGDETYGKDWNVDHRLFPHDLVRSAFAAMSDRRLERAEDGYEMLVLASYSAGEVTRNDIVGYRYFMGRGVTAAGAISKDSFGRTVERMAGCAEEAMRFARRSSDTSLAGHASGFARRLLFSLANEWYERVADADKEDLAYAMADRFGKIGVAAQLMRFVRDEAYAMLRSGARLSGDEPFLVWRDIAEGLALQCGRTTPEYRSFAAAAASHIEDMRRSVSNHSYDEQRIRIFVSTHKPTSLFESEILQPVQVGCALRDDRFPWALHDDEGENISAQNLMYCELTTQYWAWKNVDADYYGFCHYRRYFDFSPERHGENPWGEIMDGRINEEAQRRYCLDDASIAQAVEGYDLITTEVKDLREFPGGDMTPYEHYQVAPKLHIEDLDRVIAILEEMHPDYAEDARSFLYGHSSCFCNMFIMRKGLFDDYCSWLFPILERFVSETDMSTYSVEAMRTPGHLSERLFNIYVNHHLRLGADWRTKQVQCVHFEHPDPEPALVPLAVGAGTKDIVPVVFAADDAYVPMLTTTITSMLENADKDRFYDVVVLQRDISDASQRAMNSFLGGRFGNASIRFHDVSNMIDSYDLTTSNAHISIETYYRFLVQQVLPNYDKVLYLDSDLIVEGDVAELFDTELGDNLLAATRDVDYLGNLNMPGGERLAYSNGVLKMGNPYDYFQAGVLLLNTAAMRDAYSTRQWLEFASEPGFIYNDQDVLNAHCEGRVLFLDQSWNVMHDCGGRVANVFSFAPARAFNDYLAARPRARVIHYAGVEKPWNTVGCDLGEAYWHYARLTPFYERLVALLVGAGQRQGGNVMPALPPKAVSPDSPLRRVLDPIMPVGSRRREVAKAIGRAIKGL